jgi:antitoxin FitA
MCYQYGMAQALIRKINDETLNDFRVAAKEKGRSLEAELRDLIERNRPKIQKDREALRKLAQYHQSMTADGGLLTDSTAFIRWDRDTNHGKWVDDGWTDDAGD